MLLCHLSCWDTLDLSAPHRGPVAQNHSAPAALTDGDMQRALQPSAV